jgi:putative heme iron utilization protein
VPDPSVSATTADRPSDRADDRRGDHAVPGPAIAETKRTLDATPGLIGEPTDAERARTIVTAGRTAALSTVAVDSGGVPFGSLVAHAVDELGRPLLCMSDLAEHSRNLTADPRVEHMNNDHADSLIAFCRVLADRPDTATARMLDVDRYGFSVLATDGPGGDPGNPSAVRFGFDAVTDTPLGVRTAMIELVRRVRG